MKTQKEFVRALALVGAAAFAAASCSKDSTAPAGGGGGGEGLRVVNATTQPVDVLVDGALAVSGVAPGQLDSLGPAAGAHTVAFRTSGGAVSASHSVTTANGEWRTVAAVRWGASIAASDLDDTNAVVPAGATKVRVLHFAPNAGQIEVGSTRPDWNGAPLIGWKEPFLYDSTVSDPLADPYYQSTVGTWGIRVWRTPADDSLGWNGATARVTLPLASGEKRSVLVLDKPGGGIRLEVID